MKLNIKSKVFILLSVLTVGVLIFLAGCNNGLQYVKVQFECNGGSEIESITVKAGSTIDRPKEPIKDGYSFAGWYSDKDFDIEFGFENPIVQDATLYAKWIQNSQEYVNLTFETNGGSQIDAQKIEYGKLAVQPTNPIKAGFEFVGWYIDIELSAQFDFDTPLTQDITIYASWAEVDLVVDMPTVDPINPLDFNISYFDLGDTKFSGAFVDQNGDPLEDLAIVHTNGSTTVLPYGKKIGYKFLGWYDNTEGKGDRLFEISESVQYDSDIKLYAKWDTIQYVVKYNSNKPQNASGKIEGTMDDTFCTYNVLSKFEKNNFSLLGYTFKGWAEESSSDVKWFDQDYFANLVYDEDTTVFNVWAVWEANIYTIHFDTQGGTTVDSSVNVVFDSGLPSIGVPTKKGYNFLGYFFDQIQYYGVDGFGLLNYTVDGDIILTANWKAKQYKLKLDYNGGQLGSNDSFETDILFDQTLSSGLQPPTKKGYELLGFYDTLDDSGKQYIDKDMNPLSKYDVDTDLTIYAVWQAKDYKVTLVFADNTKQEITLTYDSEYTLPVDSKYGYTFLGWFGGGIQYTDSNGVCLNPYTDYEITLYSKLSANEYTIVIDFDGGQALENTTISVHAVFDKFLPTVVSPFKRGHTVNGYYVLDGSDKIYYIDKNLQSIKAWDIDNSQVVLKVDWVANQYQITFDKDGGTGGTDSVFAEFKQILPQGLVAPTKKGFEFVGYFDQYGIQYYDKDMYTSVVMQQDQDFTLYAKWEQGDITPFFKFKIYSGGYEISVKDLQDTQLVGDITIPSQYDGLPVVRIAQVGFSPNLLTYTDISKVTSYTIPSTVKEIGKYAFEYSAAKNIYFEDESLLETIENNAFYYAKIESIRLPQLLKTIGYNAFQYSNIQTIELPKSLQVIEKYAFNKCTLLTQVIFETDSTLTDIGEYAFSNLSKLPQLYIPSMVTLVDRNAFYDSTMTLYIYSKLQTTYWNRYWDNNFKGSVVYLNQ